MFESFEIEGSWWLPEKPDIKFLGTLKFNSYDGGELKLIGDFEDIEGFKYHKNFKIINGNIGTDITLHECYYLSSKYYEKDKKITKYLVNDVFKGYIFRNSSEIKFKSVLLEFNYLSNWSNVDLMHIILDNERFVKQVDIISIPPIMIDFHKEKVEIRLEFHVSKKPEINNKNEITLIQKTFLRVTPSKELDFNSCIEIAEKLMKFFSIAIDRPIQLIGFVGSLNKRESQEQLNVEVFLDIQKELIKKEDFIDQERMPFSLDHLSNKFSVILYNWFDKYQLLEPIIIHYTSIKYLPKMYSEHQFLNLVIALESYHRIKFDKEKDGLVPKNKFQEFKKLIVKAIPDSFTSEEEIEFITNFKNILNYANKLTLKRRLRRLLDINRNLLGNFIEDEENFITKVVNTRDYRVHQEKSLKKKAITDLFELYEVSRQLNFIVELCIYNELGFNDKEIKEILNRRKRNFVYFSEI